MSGKRNSFHKKVVVDPLINKNILLIPHSAHPALVYGRAFARAGYASTRNRWVQAPNSLFPF
jgi:hypothetical protein